MPAPATSPPDDRHVHAAVTNRAIIATPPDIAPAIVATRVAGRLSSDLALQLHRTMSVPGRDAHLIAALAAGSRPELRHRDRDYTARLITRIDSPIAAPAAPTR